MAAERKDSSSLANLLSEAFESQKIFIKKEGDLYYKPILLKVFFQDNLARAREMEEFSRIFSDFRIDFLIDAEQAHHLLSKFHQSVLGLRSAKIPLDQDGDPAGPATLTDQAEINKIQVLAGELVKLACQNLLTHENLIRPELSNTLTLTPAESTDPAISNQIVLAYLKSLAQAILENVGKMISTKEQDPGADIRHQAVLAFISKNLSQLLHKELEKRHEELKENKPVKLNEKTSSEVVIKTNRSRSSR